MKTNQFTYDNRSLEVRAGLVGDQHIVRVYEKGVPTNVINYTVTLEVAGDAMPWDLVADLMDSAERDFIRWSDWQKEMAAQRLSY